MSNMLRFERGELRRRANQHELLQELVFNADTDEHRDIEVITLRQHLKDKAMSRAWETDPSDFRNINEHVEQLLITKYTHASEFVEIAKGKIKIGIDAPVVSDAVVDRALALLIQVDDIIEDKFVPFGEEKQIYGS